MTTPHCLSTKLVSIIKLKTRTGRLLLVCCDIWSFWWSFCLVEEIVVESSCFSMSLAWDMNGKFSSKLCTTPEIPVGVAVLNFKGELYWIYWCPREIYIHLELNYTFRLHIILNQLVEYKWEQEELFVDTWQRYMPCTGQLIQGKFLALICKLSIRYVPSFNFFFKFVCSMFCTWKHM